MILNLNVQIFKYLIYFISGTYQGYHCSYEMVTNTVRQMHIFFTLESLIIVCKISCWQMSALSMLFHIIFPKLTKFLSVDPHYKHTGLRRWHSQKHDCLQMCGPEFRSPEATSNMPSQELEKELSGSKHLAPKPWDVCNRMSIIIELLQCDRMWTWENQPEAYEPRAHCTVSEMSEPLPHQGRRQELTLRSYPQPTNCTWHICPYSPTHMCMCAQAIIVKL